MASGNVGDICSREVIVAGRDTTVTAAAQRMRHHHVGTLVVCDTVDGGKRVPVGIVTDRDIVVEVVAPGLRGDTITVGDIMAPNLMTVRESDGVLDALQAMRYRGVRRLPVVGDDGGLRGLVAIDDILEILTEGLSDISRIIRQEHGVEAANRK